MSDSNAIDARRSKITDLAFTAAMVLIIIAAAFLRFGGLDRRPMHGDESVNAMKFIHLAEGDGYRYDPHEFHGPLLPFVTEPWRVFNPDNDRADYTAAFFRSLIAVLGTLLVTTKLGAGRMFGRGAALYAALLIAISPAMSFFSRYYIHEMLLVLTTFGAIITAWHYLRHRRVGWAIACGICLGLMHATKETCVITWFAMAVAAVVTYFIAGPLRGPGRPESHSDSAIQISHIVYGLLVAVIVSLTLFTSFFTNWAGPWDSIRTYVTWFSAGAGEQLRHEHPWWWYLQLLIWHHPKAGPWWSEALIVGLWLVGSVLAMGGWGFGGEAGRFRGPAVFMTAYTLVLLAVYSMIPYKTPWIVLGPLHGMTIVGSIGAAVIVRNTPPVWAKGLILLALAAGAGQLAHKAYETNFRFHTDARNPWVYAHPTRDVFRIADRARQIADVSGLGDRMPIRIVDQGNYWPLPYYLRTFRRVGFFPAVPEDLAGPFIIAGPRLDDAVGQRLVDTHRGEYYGLRPGVVISVYIRNDLWDAFIQRQSNEPRP